MNIPTNLANTPDRINNASSPVIKVAREGAASPSQNEEQISEEVKMINESVTAIQKPEVSEFTASKLDMAPIEE